MAMSPCRSISSYPSSSHPEPGAEAPDYPAATERLQPARAVVDFDPFEITTLEDVDKRRIVVNVAGPAALLVAKAHKLGERLTTERLIAKDAGDVYRLLDATAIADMAQTTKSLLGDDRSAETTQRGLDYVRELFATPRSPGIGLAARALAGVVDEATVATVMTGYIHDLIEAINE